MEFMELGGPIMWIILGLSVIGGGVVLDKILFFMLNAENPQKLELRIGEALWNGDSELALRISAERKTSLHRLFYSALTHWKAPHDALKELLEQETRREIFRWNKRIGVLSVIARVAPLLGLLGTVLGMVDMFQSLPDGGSMITVAGGIWKALFTTVAGLSVAIPALLLHAWLCYRVDDEEEKLQRAGEFLIRERILPREKYETQRIS